MNLYLEGGQPRTFGGRVVHAWHGGWIGHDWASMAPDALAKMMTDLIITRQPKSSEGNLLAVPRGKQPPPGYVLP